MPYLSDYIWQQDRFDLIPSTETKPPWSFKPFSSSKTKQKSPSSTTTPPPSSSTSPPFLWASIDFGDNIEDEWFIVWLLKHLTHHFPSITARVWDNDGEFLLIEAAYHIPRWLKPETAQNRVWIHGGDFHIVPQPRYAGDPLLSPTPTLQQALQAVRSSSVVREDGDNNNNKKKDGISSNKFINTKASGTFHQALNIRLAKYPEEAKRQMHLTIAHLPLQLAFILNQQPQLIAPIVEAFHYRTPDDVKAATTKMMTMMTGGANASIGHGSEFVTVNVQFTRCLYAQMALQEYNAPKGWKTLLSTDTNNNNKEQYTSLVYNHDEAVDLGVKIAAGYEMMMSNPSRYGATKSNINSNSSTSSSNVDIDGGWKKYQFKLQSLGYYKHSLPGSKEYQGLEEQAREKYASTVGCTVASRSLSQAPAAVAHQLMTLFNANGGGDMKIVEEFHEQTKVLLPPADESWLREGASEIDAELDRREAEVEKHQSTTHGGSSKKKSKQGNKEEDELDLEELTSKFKKFMATMSGLEGADVDGDDDGDIGGGMGKDFDERTFLEELGKVFEMAGGEDDEADGGEGSYASSSTEGSSFFGDGDDDDDDDSDYDGPLTATDSDDDEEEEESEGVERGNAHNNNNNNKAFYDAYSSILASQLAKSKLKDSFIRAPAAATDSTTDNNISSTHVGGSSMEMRDVDVDVNLVESLLQSHAEQAGLPGPASNLAGLLGLKLPHHSKNDDDTGDDNEEEEEEE